VVSEATATWRFTNFVFCIVLFPYILFEKYIYISAMEMASPGNQHCANCIGTLSFPIGISTTDINEPALTTSISAAFELKRQYSRRGHVVAAPC